MGVNSHVVPGDVVATVSDDERLYARHPDEALEDRWHFEDSGDGDIVAKLPYQKLLLVISVARAGSAQQGHSFFVMTMGETPLCGWVRNHSVMSVICAHMPT